MNATPPDWEDILPEPFVTLLLGERGSGKTALGHRLLEVFEDSDRDAYIMGFPEHKRDELPEWLEVLPPTTTRDQWPENSIVLIHEAHQLLHARRSMDAENLNLDELVTVSRHKDSNIIYDTQQSQRLDKNAVAAVDAICVRWPALMQEEFERRAVRPIIEDARDALEKYVTIHDGDGYTYVEHDEDGDGVEELKKHVYVHADQFRGEYPYEVRLADHWSEDISKAYGGMGDTDGSSGRVKDLDDVRESMAKPEDVTTRDPEDVETIIENAGGDSDATDDVQQQADDDGGGGGGFDPQKGRDFIERMLEADNTVMPNSAPQPTVEIIVPRDMADEVEQLIEEWDINPQGPRVIEQKPLFKEQRPDIAESLSSFQFLLDERDSLDSSGYDLSSIIQGLEGEPVLYTKSPAIAVSLPVED